jgi:hypothetical protein
MKIFLTSASSDKVYQHERLRELWMLSSQKHSLCQQAEEADLVLLSDISGPNWFEDLRKNENIIDPSKCFVVTDSDFPMPLLHGVYTSNHKGLKFRSRFRTGAYNLFSHEVKNPFVTASQGDAFLHGKKFLYSFIGQDSSPLRLELFKIKSSRSDVHVVNATVFFNAYRKAKNYELHQKMYFENILASKFVLCPKGTSNASIRLFEVMKLGVAPVIISDDWIFPSGPLWETFSVIVKEKDLDRLDVILEEREKDYQLMGERAHQAYKTFFADEVYFDYLIDQCIDIKKHQKIPESLFWYLRNFVVRYWMLQQR